MSGHICRGSASEQTIYPAWSQMHRLGDKRCPVRIPDLCRKSMILFFFCTQSSACDQHILQGQAMWCAGSTSTGTPSCSVQTTWAWRRGLPLAPLCQMQAPGATPGMLLSPLPTGFCAQTPHCPQALQLQAGLGHARGCAPDKSPSANSCSRETGRNQLYRCYQGLSIICSVPALLYLMKQSWLCS